MASKIRKDVADIARQASGTTGIFSLKQGAKYASGARVVLKINGELVGFAFSINWRISTDWQEVRTIDNYMPEELAPKHVSVEGSLGMLHIPGQSANSKLWQADMLSFMFHKYITIEVRDSATDQLLFYAPQAVITSRAEDISVDSLSRVNLSWKAIGWRDEHEPVIPK